LGKQIAEMTEGEARVAPSRTQSHLFDGFFGAVMPGEDSGPGGTGNGAMHPACRKTGGAKVNKGN